VADADGFAPGVPLSLSPAVQMQYDSSRRSPRTITDAPATVATRLAVLCGLACVGLSSDIGSALWRVTFKAPGIGAYGQARAVLGVRMTRCS
jgi:hypothetical protein